MKVVTAGRGKLGQALRALLEEKEIEYIDYATPREVDLIDLKPDVAIYCGKVHNFADLLRFCEQYNIPLINASTDLGDLIPTNSKCVFIDTPNASIPMIHFMSAFPPFARRLMKAMNVSITESHQAQKASKSGTAKGIAKLLKVEESSINDVRKMGTQLSLGVPAEHLDGHAYHWFDFFGGQVQIQVTTKIHGRATYAEGLYYLAQQVLERNIEPGVYPAFSLLI